MNLKEFSQKWLGKFQDPNVNYIELVDHYFADDCEALGFIMDCGNSFSMRYGKAVSNVNELIKVIDEVNDIKLLGSALYSQWRYYNHWAYTGAEIVEPENREWFLVALRRMEKLSDMSTVGVKIGDFARLLLILLPFGVLLVMLIKMLYLRPNNKYGQETIPLTVFKCIAKFTYQPIKRVVITYWTFLQENKKILDLWLVIWLMNLNLMSIIQVQIGLVWKELILRIRT